jgi:spermidine synthase
MRSSQSLSKLLGALFAVIALAPWTGRSQPNRQVVFEQTSKYHFIQVYDEDGLRTLAFNGSSESRMSLTDPLTGHFEYTEYFAMPLLWNPVLQHVLMAGLGGGSAPRAFAHYFTNTVIDAVEIDPVVIDVAKNYFHLTESLNLRLHIDDARQFLRRSTNIYDAILMDAYATTRYGSSLPPHLTTKEFFLIADSHLTANGVLAYNVIGQISGPGDKLVGALFRTMKEVFPQVYLFPARETPNVVFIATKSREHFTWAQAQDQALARLHSGMSLPPAFSVRAKQLDNDAPTNAAQSIILTDNFAPIENLMQGAN